MEYRVDGEHHGCDTSERTSPAWITPLQPDVEAGVNVEMDARPSSRAGFMEGALTSSYADLRTLENCRYLLTTPGRRSSR